MKHQLNILWLDDQRDPNKYFKKKDDKGSGTLHNNLMFYKKLSTQYDLSFIWVKNYNEFTNYILNNGVPEFVSFDHDLSKSSQKGDPYGYDCAKWLIDYCKKNNISVPKYFIHSANPKWGPEIEKIMSNSNNPSPIQINEIDIMEMVKNVLGLLCEAGVYMDRRKVNNKKKTIGLTYNPSIGSRNKSSLTSTDNLKTDKMEMNNGDTYKVKLKGGLTCYNITSINGVEVMHYFKRKKDNKDTTIKVSDGTNKEDYRLTMDNAEENLFFERFIKKIEFVIQYCLNEFKLVDVTDKLSGISIYPVPSTSNFNEFMSEKLKSINILGLPVQKINSQMLVKDLRNLRKDDEFINKNSEYFSNKISNSNLLDYTVNDAIQTVINKYNSLKPVEKIVERANAAYKRMMDRYHVYKERSSIKNMLKDYIEYYKCVESLKSSNFTYENLTTGKSSKFRGSKNAEDNGIAREKKSTKGPSTSGHTEAIWSLIGTEAKNIGLNKIPIHGWEKVLFQIKNLSNGERMGLRGFYNQNTNEKLVQDELEKTKNTIFVIFDDNVSGGATLSDICYQCREMGIKYIIPITFGKMEEKWVLNMIQLNRPTDSNGVYGNFNY